MQKRWLATGTLMTGLVCSTVGWAQDFRTDCHTIGGVTNRARFECMQNNDNYVKAQLEQKIDELTASVDELNAKLNALTGQLDEKAAKNDLSALVRYNDKVTIARNGQCADLAVPGGAVIVTSCNRGADAQVWVIDRPLE